MYLRRIVGNGLAAVNEWRRMWNEEVLPYLRSQRPVAGPGVKIDQRPAGMMITATGVDSSAPAAAGGGGNIRIVAMSTNPAGGFGVAGGNDIIPNSDGSYSIPSPGIVIGFTTLYV